MKDRAYFWRSDHWHLLQDGAVLHIRVVTYPSGVAKILEHPISCYDIHLSSHLLSSQGCWLCWRLSQQVDRHGLILDRSHVRSHLVVI